MHTLFSSLLPMEAFGLIPQEALTEWIKRLVTDVRSVIGVIITLAVIAFVAVRCVKSGFALSSIIIGALGGGLVLWLTVGDGMSTIADLMKAQADAKPGGGGQ